MNQADINICEKIDIKPFAYAVSLFNGKWKMHILFWLWKKEVMRYSEIKRELGKVTHKMLSTQLKERKRDNPLCPFYKKFVNGDMNIYQRMLK